MTDSNAILTSRAAADTEVFTTHLPLPGLGQLPVNAFLLRAAEPVLIDTGVVALGDAYFDHIAAAIEPSDLRWIWITHMDADHVGCLERLLAAAPKARLVTTFLGMGKLGLRSPPPADRIYLLNPGQQLDVGDRRLLAVAPPTFDAPETTGLFDAKTRTLFSADCFGALMSDPAESAHDLSPRALAEGMATWTAIDAPWFPAISPAAFQSAVETIRSLGPSTVLSSHLPPATGMLDTLIADLAAARSAPRFVGPDQEALIAMLSAA